MTDQGKLDKLIRTIRALKAKAEGTNNEVEAATFAAKAAEMMAQYGLEEAQLKVEEQSTIEADRDRHNWTWAPERQMVTALCRLYMVRPVTHGGDRKLWTLIGRKHNIMMVKEMAEYLKQTTNRLSSQWRKSRGATSSEMFDFRKGCFMRLAERIDELRRAQERAAAPQWHANGNPGNLPALYQQEHKMVTQFRDAMFPNLGKGRHANIKMGMASHYGRQAGDGVSLNRQVSSSGNGTTGTLMIGRR